MKKICRSRINPGLIVLAGAASLTLAHGASAQCLPDPVADGGTVTCTAVDGDGFSTAALGITFDHTAGGQIVGNVALGAGQDMYRQSGAATAVDGTVHTGAGNDTLSLTGGTNTDKAPGFVVRHTESMAEMSNIQLTEMMERVQAQLPGMSLELERRSTQVDQFELVNGRHMTTQQGQAQALAELTQATNIMSQGLDD